MSPYVSERVLLEGGEEMARAFIEAIPEDRRAHWDRIFVERPEERRPEVWRILTDAHGADRLAEYEVVFLKGPRYIALPVRDAFLREAETALAAAALERTARMAIEHV